MELILRTTTLRSLNYFTLLMIRAFFSYFSRLLRSMRFRKILPKPRSSGWEEGGGYNFILSEGRLRT